MNSTNKPKTQLDELKEEKAQLDAEIKEKRRELSLLDGKTNPRYRDIKICLLFLTEKRNIVQLKVKYRESNGENVGIYNPSAKGVQAIIDKFKEERVEIRAEIAEIRRLIASEKKKVTTGKGKRVITQLEDSLASLITKRDSMSSKIGYHRRKLQQ